MVAWIKALLDREAQKNAGDPGPVLARRLNNAELDYTIADLTGVDMHVTREFPVDPANEAGFDNSGESLAMSPALFHKYLAATKRVAAHLVLEPAGFEFATEPAVTETDRDKYCVRRIINFYDRHKVDYAQYFLAAWRFQNRSALGKPNSTLSDFAAEAGLSTPYLATLWKVLGEKWPESGPMAELQALWRKLPADAEQQPEARRGCERMRDVVIRLRKGFEPRVPEMRARGISPGSQPFVLWRARRLASGRIECTRRIKPERREGVLPRIPRRVLRVRPSALLRSQGGFSGKAALGRVSPDAGLLPRRRPTLRAGSG